MKTDPHRCAETTPEHWMSRLRDKQRDAKTRLLYWQRHGEWPQGRERIVDEETLPALLRRQAW